jgi:L-arabinokinase
MERVRGLNRTAGQRLHEFFERGRSVSVARAPGRLDVMGGIADYSGSLVLQLPIREAALVAAQRNEQEDWQIASLPCSDHAPLRCVRLTKHEMAGLDDYSAAQQRFQQDASKAWAAYLSGTVLVLGRELGADIDGGMRLLVQSDVPEAKGVSSSAALEVAAMRAVAHQLGITIDGAEAARLCQLAENLVVGAPCGIMDQMTSALGRTNKLLALLCQPAEVQGFVTVPDSIGLWGIDSGIRHAVSGSDYTSVRTGAFMGYRMIASLAGLDVAATDGDGLVKIDDPRWHGYLANLTPAEFEASYAEQLPERTTGVEFLDQYRGTSDRVTRVQPDRSYAIRQPTAHPIYEHARVCRFRELLAAPVSQSTCIEMGELMYASHASYSACGLGSSGTDRLVELVRQAGPAAGLFGAKITGGGSGGTVAVLGHSTSGDAVAEIAGRYADESGQEGGYVFKGSSTGAWNEDVVACEVNS